MSIFDTYHGQVFVSIFYTGRNASNPMFVRCAVIYPITPSLHVFILYLYYTGNYLSATRQIENLICTNRESLIGSGAWNKEFYAELQSRPFYSSVPTLMCTDSRPLGEEHVLFCVVSLHLYCSEHR